MKSLQKVLSMSLALSSPLALAEELYTTYAEVGVAYNIANQKSIINNKTKDELFLYGNSVVSYHIETGIKVPVEGGDTFKMGLYWYDLLNQDQSSKLHSPYKLEVFSDYVWNFRGNWFSSVGVGYKILEQTEIKYELDGVEYTLPTGDNLVVDKITARFSVGKHYGDYTVSLDHHSQWLKGKPFDKEWEYHVTYVGISYSF